jgi:NADPH:quinone reductase-like Zn-dependent oxidoreductase
MKAIVYQHYGPPSVLQLKEVPKPEIKPGEILIKVKAVAVTAADSRLRGSRFPAGFTILARLIFGITAPRQKILGSSFSGEVVAVGKDVSEFKVGDEVFGMKGFELGAYAEYIKIGQDQAVIKKPKSLSYTEAAALTFGGTTALYFLRDVGKVKHGQRVLINGASGAVGSSAVQIAKALGATVAAVCGPKNQKLVESLGADEVFDYTKVDVRTHINQYDVVLDAVGNLTFDECEQIAKPNGKCLLVVAGLPKMLQAGIQTQRSPKNISYLTGTASESKKDIQFLADLFTQHKLNPVLSKVFPFAHAAEAHELVDSGHKTGNVVLDVSLG